MARYAPLKTKPDAETLVPGVTAEAGTTKARIERAALTLFCARGVDAVTTREIAAASGVSEGALYRHFPSKCALSETLFFAVHQRLAGEVRAAADSADDIEGKVRAIVGAYCRVADEDWTLFSYHLLTTHRFLPYADQTARKPKIESPVGIVEKIVDDAMENNTLPPGEAGVKAAAALGVVLQTALHKIYGRVTGPLAAHEAALARAVIAVLQS